MINEVQHALAEALEMINDVRKLVRQVEAQVEPLTSDEHRARYQRVADHATAARVFVTRVEEWAKSNVKRLGG